MDKITWMISEADSVINNEATVVEAARHDSKAFALLYRYYLLQLYPLPFKQVEQHSRCWRPFRTRFYGSPGGFSRVSLSRMRLFCCLTAHHCPPSFSGFLSPTSLRSTHGITGWTLLCHTSYAGTMPGCGFLFSVTQQRQFVVRDVGILACTGSPWPTVTTQPLK